MPVPVLVSIDELQNMLLPMKYCKRLDRHIVDVGAQSDAQLLLKKLFLYSNNNVMFASACSSCLDFFAQLAMMPPNVIALILHHTRVRLPATHNVQAMELVFRSILAAHRVIPNSDAVLPPLYVQLLAWADNTALLCYAYNELQYDIVQHQADVDVRKFFRDITFNNLARKSLDDWRRVLEPLDQEKRRWIAKLYDSSSGCHLLQVSNSGLRNLLEMMTEPVPGPGVDGRDPPVFLSGSVYRSILQLAVDKNGVLIKVLEPAMLGRQLTFLDVWFHMNVLAEFNEKMIASDTKALLDALKAPCEELEAQQGPASTWHVQEWFKLALNSPHNQSHGERPGLAQSYLRSRQHIRCREAHLVWYMRLVRNCIVNNSMLEAPHLPSGQASTDVLDMVMNSPLAQPATCFIYRFQDLRALIRQRSTL